MNVPVRERLAERLKAETDPNRKALIEREVNERLREALTELLQDETDPTRKTLIARKLREVEWELRPGGAMKDFRCSDASRLLSAPAPDAPERVWTFRANDGELDRYHDRLAVDGWEIDNFNANRGPILYNHDAGDGGPFGAGSKNVLPIGKGRAYVSGDALLVDITFDPLDEFAQKVEQKVRDGYLNAVSVRYTMKEFEQNAFGGLDSFRQELLEISVVTIPGNQRALRITPAMKSAEAAAVKSADRLDVSDAERREKAIDAAVERAIEARAARNPELARALADYRARREALECQVNFENERKRQRDTWFTIVG